MGVEITWISRDELRHMEGSEGLILQGCGGDLTEWVDGLNEMLTEDGILKNGAKFQRASAFHHDGLTNLLFELKDAEFELGKLAIWRLRTHSVFGGTWLSDYVPNRLGGFTQKIGDREKPDCEYVNITGPSEAEAGMGFLESF